jgi:hypothetical protein
MMGFEKLLRGLYGSVPYIDLDRKLARVRVPDPTTFDFAALAVGIKKNNLGLTGIWVEVDAVQDGGRVTLQPTGQSFPLEGVPRPGAARFKVVDWAAPRLAPD